MDATSNYDLFFSLPDIFPKHGDGIVTGRNRLTIHQSPDDVLNTVTQLAELPEEKARKKYLIGRDTRDRNLNLIQVYRYGARYGRF